MEILSKDSFSTPAFVWAIVKFSDRQKSISNFIVLDCEQGEVYQSDVFEKKKWTDFGKINNTYSANSLVTVTFRGWKTRDSREIAESKVVFYAVKKYK